MCLAQPYHVMISIINIQYKKISDSVKWDISQTKEILKKKYIVNLSDVCFTEDQVKVLHKGLKFCPTPGPPDRGNIVRTWTSFTGG